MSGISKQKQQVSDSGDSFWKEQDRADEWGPQRMPQRSSSRSVSFKQWTPEEGVFYYKYFLDNVTFKNEKSAYSACKHLQGTVVPRCDVTEVGISVMHSSH